MKSLTIFLLLCVVTIYAKKTLINLPRVPRVPPPVRSKRIIGGDLARAGQCPWQVAIYKDTADGTYFCSGILISEQWILTAAQCVHDAKQFTITMGSNELNSNDANRVTVATDIYYHESRFDPTVSLAHDVGVIKLRMPVLFSDYIQPIVFANMGYIYPGRVVEAAGWGQISDTTGELVNELRFVEISLIANFACQTYYGSQLWGSMTCAEGNYNEGICFGDVGGPLVTPALIGNHSVAVAIASFISQNGCESLDPTGYTRIDSYNGWITNTTKYN